MARAAAAALGSTAGLVGADTGRASRAVGEAPGAGRASRGLAGALESCSSLRLTWGRLHDMIVLDKHHRNTRQVGGLV